MSLDKKNKAELIAMLEQLQAEDANATITALQNEVEASKAAIAERDVRIAELENDSDVAGYEKQIERLVKENTALKENKGNPNPMVEVDNEHIQILGPIMVGGLVKSVTDLQKDPDLVRAQLKKGNKMFRKAGAALAEA